ncbi:uncharacterized protein LOC121050037 [Rosa chinensis]|uniref:uncharacterized protein LOC121050037 n=1 Tax=Rosa chinensis TaxID=74649 RepID=UPI001AD8DD33|nr:uncharacterized protein LOC121050037 [Rosa chinensis]
MTSKRKSEPAPAQSPGVVNRTQEAGTRPPTRSLTQRASGSSDTSAPDARRELSTRTTKKARKDAELQDTKCGEVQDVISGKDRAVKSEEVQETKSGDMKEANSVEVRKSQKGLVRRSQKADSGKDEEAKSEEVHKANSSEGQSAREEVYEEVGDEKETGTIRMLQEAADSLGVDDFDDHAEAVGDPDIGAHLQDQDIEFVAAQALGAGQDQHHDPNPVMFRVYVLPVEAAYDEWRDHMVAELNKDNFNNVQDFDGAVWEILANRDGGILDPDYSYIVELGDHWIPLPEEILITWNWENFNAVVDGAIEFVLVEDDD